MLSTVCYKVCLECDSEILPFDRRDLSRFADFMDQYHTFNAPDRLFTRFRQRERHHRSKRVLDSARFYIPHKLLKIYYPKLFESVSDGSPGRSVP